jgi:hypothetical protein
MRNGQGFSAADYGDIRKPREGVAGGLGSRSRPRANPLAPQEATLLFGGTETDGDYVAAFVLPDGTELTATVTRAAASPATNADLAAAMVTAIEGDDAWANVATAEVDGGTAEQVNLTFLHAGIVYPLGTSSAPAPGTLTDAITVAAGGAAMPVGRFLIPVANAQDPDIAAQGLPLVGTTAAQIAGFSASPHGQIVNSESTDADAIESYLAGDMLSSGYEGCWYVRNRGTVASVPNVTAVFVVVNPAGGDEPGQVRSDADGGNTVQLTATQAYWRDATEPGELGRIRIRI